MKNIPIYLFIITLMLSCHPSAQKENQRNNSTDSISGKLIVFHAGSLAVPFKELADSFKTLHPNIEILAEASGSVECARKITEIKKPCDILLSADYKVIDNLLIPGFTNWNIPFATNEMVIAYNPNARKVNEMNSTSWTKLLLSKEVAYGRSDPDADPCGYRTLLCLQLAEKHYGLKGFYEKMKAKDNQNIRPKEVDLLALLETGNIDYIFIYRSVALQHHLKFINLPQEINLGNKDFAEIYALAQLEVKGKKPGEKIKQTGEAMVYSFTIPYNAPNRKAAEAFAAFLMDSQKGLKIMEKNGQPPLTKPIVKNYDKLPEVLKKLTQKPN
ncbi:MAG: extracellular solute-binding protein [Bacteroidetes bacterium]|nr:extracellular solute-binding protein [Bacteroidota bacterium]